MQSGVWNSAKLQGFIDSQRHIGKMTVYRCTEKLYTHSIVNQLYVCVLTTLYYFMVTSSSSLVNKDIEITMFVVSFLLELEVIICIFNFRY